MLPVEYTPGVHAITLEQIETPGKDEETDDALFERFVDYITNPPFGGNRADYRDYLRTIDGVGANKLYRSDPEKGHVRIVFLGTDGLPPSNELIEQTQEIIDPYGDGTYPGQGIGQAPMCHYVHVEGAQAFAVDVTTSVLLTDGWTLGQVESDIQAAVEGYFAQLRVEWGKLIAAGDYRYEETTVRIALIDSAILELQGVKDIQGTEINGMEENMTVHPDSVPVLRNITIATL